MWKKLKQFFEKLPEQYMSGFDYTTGLTPLRFEIYEDVAVVYIKKPGTLEFNMFYRREYYSGMANNLAELMTLAHDKIDELK